MSNEHQVCQNFKFISINSNLTTLKSGHFTDDVIAGFGTSNQVSLISLNSNLISLNKFKFNTELTTSNISFQLDKRYDVYIINLITDKNDVFKTVTVMEEIDESDGNMLVEIFSPWGTTPAKVLINFDNIQYFNINVSIRELGSFTKVTLSSIIGIKLPLNQQ